MAKKITRKERQLKNGVGVGKAWFVKGEKWYFISKDKK